MTKEERRLHLLDAAFRIIRTEGTAALTLVRLAEVAGVSRPVVYEHFGTREGLLLALYQRFDEVLGHTIDEALRAGADTLQDAGRVVATAYIEAVIDAGPECGAVAAALSGRPETASFRQTSREFYVERLRVAVLPHVGAASENASVLIGILGALDSLSQEAVTGHIPTEEAVAAATTIILGAFGDGTGQGPALSGPRPTP